VISVGLAATIGLVASIVVLLAAAVVALVDWFFAPEHPLTESIQKFFPAGPKSE